MPEKSEVPQLLNREIGQLPGVADRRAVLLNKMGIYTWYDLATWFPRDYEDWSECHPLSQLDQLENQEASFLGRVSRKPLSHRKGNLLIIQTALDDSTGSIQAVWFNQPWIIQQLKTGGWYQFRGKISRRGRHFSVQNPAYVPVDPDNPANQGMKPVYRLTSGLTQGVMRKLVQTLIPLLLGSLPEPLPVEVRREHRLCAVDFAYSRAHNPANREEAEICRRRLVFEEFFLLQAGLYLLRRANKEQIPARSLKIEAKADRAWQQAAAKLPFALTGAQNRVIGEIRHDLNQDRPMNRLVQGDVGSGKTVVAALAMLQAAIAGGQSVMMAPTSILARQHYQTLCSLLAGSGVNINILTGATRAAERNKILRELSSGRIDILVGTHALIEDRVRFHSLALAVTDEQHRFGVRQRLKLAEQNPNEKAQPHVLVMTATPIPRSLALIVYGDLDISIIDEKPPGRKPVRTYTATSRDRQRIDRLLSQIIGQGRQAYVVCPAIEDETEQDLESVISTYNRLAADILPDYKVALMHGQLKQAEKDRIMEDFTSGKIQVLVSTTVIEVGVDNPNATLMIVENAERFGLAQLHQLRGRIGRGSHDSLCLLVSDLQAERAKERLKILCLSDDGFAIAEKDLELRGPGDFFGTRQHGLPPLRLARIYEDYDLLRSARASLQKITTVDPDLVLWQHREIRQILDARFGQYFWQPGL